MFIRDYLLLQACPLNPTPDAQLDVSQKSDQFSDCFMPAIRAVVDFSKCIPGFQVLSQEDQVTLLKAGTFEVVLVHLSCLFDTATNTMLFTNGKIFQRTSLSVSSLQLDRRQIKLYCFFMYIYINC